MAIFFGMFGFLSVVATGVFAAFAVASIQRASRVGTAPGRAGKLKPGFRKVRGRVAPAGKPLFSPLTNQRCVYYRLLVEEEHSMWKNPAGGSTITSPGAILAGLFGGALGSVVCA